MCDACGTCAQYGTTAPNEPMRLLPIPTRPRQIVSQDISIGRIRKYLPNDGIKRLVNALVMSRLDYSNSLLYGLLKYQIDKLQRLQNTAARLVAGTRRSDHIKPVLKDLHWLPIQSRIIFKILLMSYKIIHGLAPKYLTSLIQIHQQSRKLRSSNRCLLTVPSSRPRTTTYGDLIIIIIICASLTTGTT